MNIFKKIAVGATALIVLGSTSFAAAEASGVAAGVDFSDVGVGIAAIGGTLAAVYVIARGIKMVLAHIK
jgi:hypothetical protein